MSKKINIEKESPEYFMNLAIEEMRKSKSEHKDKTDPKVGAVLVSKEGRLIDKAFRGELRAGDHAEYALIERKRYNENLSGCTLFTTLEPCVDRNPPKDGCGFRIITARISKVYIGHEDPDPTVAGDGARVLKENGIEVKYFTREFEETIHNENIDFFTEAKERAKKLNKKELLPSNKPLNEELVTYRFEDFSKDALDEFISRANIKYKRDSDNFRNLLNQIGLIKISERNNRQIIRPTINGVLLFAKEPTRGISQAKVKVITEADDGNRFSEEFKGPLVSLPDKIENHLKVIIPKTFNREKFRREHITDIPFPVLREVILNAIVHRDYLLTGMNIIIYVYPTRIEIHSPGKPVIPLEQFRNFTAPTVRRNHIIAYIFNEMELIEEEGIGMQELSQLKSKYDLPDPQFIFENNYFKVILSRIKLSQIKSQALDNLSQSERKGFEKIKLEGNISSSDYAKFLNLEERTARRHLMKMVTLGLIEKEGKGKSTTYKFVD